MQGLGTPSCALWRSPPPTCTVSSVLACTVLHVASTVRALTRIDITSSSTPTLRAVAGPALTTGRLSHGCATLDDGTIVVAGGDTNSGRSNTVEILLDGGSSWVPSKSIFDFPML